MEQVGVGLRQRRLPTSFAINVPWAHFPFGEGFPRVSNLVALLILAVAALLEAGGDAIVRTGLHSPTGAAKGGLIALGGLVLLAYGVVVNTPSWDFGRLLGVYVTLFFVAAQVINFFAFGVRPDLSVLLGGLLIVSGGLLMTLWHPG